MFPWPTCICRHSVITTDSRLGVWFDKTLPRPETFPLFMAALRSRCGHYIFVLWFLLLFSSPNLSGRRLDIYHTSAHGVALVRL